VQLPKSVHEKLAHEFRFAADGMVGTNDLLAKLYLFSTFYGETNRALNEVWDRELALMHMVTQAAHQQISNAVAVAPRQLVTIRDKPTILTLPTELAETLTKLGVELAEIFESKNIDSVRLHDLLYRVNELAYTTTGNGFFLYLKGAIKL